MTENNKMQRYPIDFRNKPITRRSVPYNSPQWRLHQQFDAKYRRFRESLRSQHNTSGWFPAPFVPPQPVPYRISIPPYNQQTQSHQTNLNYQPSTNPIGVENRNNLNSTEIPLNHSESNSTNSVVNKKRKRKSTAILRSNPSKQWNREDAIKALALENESAASCHKVPILILRFPDPELSIDIVKSYSPEIDSVHFQNSMHPRYCHLNLKSSCNVEKIIESISKIPFGTGFLSAELKPPLVSTQQSSYETPEGIDPYTIYVGNLPNKITSATVESYFPGARRIDIGFAQKLKNTRYAFVRYSTVDEAIEAYKRAMNICIDNRSLIVRFRRHNGGISMGNVSQSSISNNRSNNMTASYFNTEEATKKSQYPVNADRIDTSKSKESIKEVPDKVNQVSPKLSKESTLQNGIANHHFPSEIVEVNNVTSEPSVKQEEQPNLEDGDIQNSFLGMRYEICATEIKSEREEFYSDTQVVYQLGEPILFDSYNNVDTDTESESGQPAVTIERIRDTKYNADKNESDSETNEKAKEHAAFVKKLYKQLRRYENNSTGKDDLDDLFRSDSEDS